jgi:cytochrome P450
LIAGRRRPKPPLHGDAACCASSAPLEAQAAFTALLERFARIELAGEPVWWVDRPNQRGLQNLSVRLGL